MDMRKMEVREPAELCDPLKRLGPAGARVVLRLLEPNGDPQDPGYAWVHAYGVHKETGVSYPTAWLLLRALEEADVVEAREAPERRRRGRSPRLFRLKTDKAREARLAVDRVLAKRGRLKAARKREAAHVPPEAVRAALAGKLPGDEPLPAEVP